MKLYKSIITIAALFIFAAGANAQLGGFMKKVQNKIDEGTKKVDTNTSVGASGGGVPGQQSSDDSSDWGTALQNPSFTRTANDAALRRLIQNGMDGDYGKGGLLVFSKEVFGKKTATINDTVLRFSGGDPINMTAFFATDHGKDPYDVGLSMHIKVVTVGEAEGSGSYYNANTRMVDYGGYKGPNTRILPLDFMPAGGKAQKFQKQVGEIAQLLLKLDKGTHIVQVRLYSNMNGTNAVGAFYYDNTSGGSDIAIQEALKSVTMPTPVKRDAALEKGIIDLLNGMGGGKALKVSIMNPDWIPLRHEITGVLIGRIINTVVGVRSDDGTCFREGQSYTQDLNGRTYTNLRLNGTREQTPMACENLGVKP